MTARFMGEEVDDSKLRRLAWNSKTLGSEFFAVTIAAFLVGLIVGGYLSFTSQPVSFFELNRPEEWIIFSVMIFIGSALFFGRIGFIISALGGLMAGHVMNQSVIAGFLAIIPLLLCSYAGTLLGQKLGNDFSGRDNVFDYSRGVVLYLGIGLISAIALAFLIPVIPFSGEGINQIIRGMGW